MRTFRHVVASMFVIAGLTMAGEKGPVDPGVRKGTSDAG
jgi:hypothetical protein